MKKILMGALAMGLGLSMTACNERTVARTAAIVGGSLLIGAAYDYNYGRTHWRTRHYRRGSYCWDRYDGRYCRTRRGGWHRVGWRGRHDDGNVQLMAKKAVAQDVALAKKYAISRSAARQVLNAFNAVKRDGRLEALEAIGLQRRDIVRLTRGHAPSEYSVHLMAKNLGASVRSVNALITDVGEDFEIQSHNGKVH